MSALTSGCERPRAGLVILTGSALSLKPAAMPNRFDKRSQEHLQGVHPDLVKVMVEAYTFASPLFIITEGLRTESRQRELVAAGASRTMNSRHLTGHAVDVAIIIAGEVRWDWPLYVRLAANVKHSAMKVGIPIVWGGDWTQFRDGPHFELERGAYP